MAFHDVWVAPKRLPTTDLKGEKKGGKFEKIKARAIHYNHQCDNPLYVQNFDARLAELRELRYKIDRYVKGQWKFGGQPLREHGEEKVAWADTVLKIAVDDEITATIEAAVESESRGGPGLGAESFSPKPLGRRGEWKERAVSAVATFDPRGAKAMGGHGGERIELGVRSDFDLSDLEEEGLQGEEEEEEESEEEGEEGAELIGPEAQKVRRDFVSLEDQLEIVWPIEQKRLINGAARGERASYEKAANRRKQKGQMAMVKTAAKMVVGEALEVIGPFAGLIAKAPLAAKATRDTGKQRMKLKGARAGARAAGNAAMVSAIARVLKLKKVHQKKKGLGVAPGAAVAQKAYGLLRSSETKAEEREREDLAKFFLEAAREGDEIAQAVVYTLVKGERYYIAAMDDDRSGYKLVADKLKT